MIDTRTLAATTFSAVSQSPLFNITATRSPVVIPTTLMTSSRSRHSLSAGAHPTRSTQGTTLLELEADDDSDSEDEAPTTPSTVVPSSTRSGRPLGRRAPVSAAAHAARNTTRKRSHRSLAKRGRALHAQYYILICLFIKII